MRDDLRAGEVAAAVFGAQGVKTRPADFFATLRDDSRPRGRRAGVADAADAALAKLRRLCPALSPVAAP